MSDVSWDADDFEPPPPPAAPVTSDKWEGEDEEDEIRDNWDDEEEDKDKSGTADPSTIPVKKKKKKLTDIIAEKEAKQIEAMERKKKEAEEAAKDTSAEGKLAEKLRLQKIQEDADLQLANELMGTCNSSVNDEEAETKLLDSIDLSTTEGLDSFRKCLLAKVRATDRLEKRPYFISFLEDLARDLCQNLEAEEVKRVSAVLNLLYNEKVRGSKPKNKKKGGAKAKLNVGQGAISDDVTNDFGGYNEYDDFI